MGINVPSSTPITISAVEANDEYYQTFTIANSIGELIEEANPLPVAISVSGYASISATYQGTVVPVGGVYINDLGGGDFTEMVDGEVGTIRLNNRRAIMTASDGQVTVLNSSEATNYHDVLVASGEFTGFAVPAYAEFFTYTNSDIRRLVYIPMSRAGFRRANIYLKHTLINDSDSQPADIGLVVYADFGQFTDDFEVYTTTMSGIPAAPVSLALLSYSTTTSGSNFVHVPALDSPVAGMLVAFEPGEPVSGSIEIYASKSA
jgi:hypothetical protein